MPGSEETWRPRRIAAFLAIGLVIYAVLFVWSDRNLHTYAQRNPFHRIATAPAFSDWIVLGASHAMPLGFGTIPDLIEDRTNQRTLTLAMTGGGPFTWRLIAERYFSDRRTAGVLIILDEFSFADGRWNAGRMDDGDVLPKIPADWRTQNTLARAISRGLPVTTWAGYVSGFARINDKTRFDPDIWEGENKFDSAPRPSDSADRARADFLYPGPPELAEITKGLADLEAIILLARSRKAQVVVVRPPLPDRFRTRLPELQGFDQRLLFLLDQFDVTLHDYSRLIPEPAYYFDTDHLNRKGIERFLDEALVGALLERDDSDQ